VLEKVFYTSVLVRDQDKALDYRYDRVASPLASYREGLGLESPGVVGRAYVGDDQDVRIVARSPCALLHPMRETRLPRPGAARRTLDGTMFLLALIVVPLLEVAAFVAVGLSIGWLLAIALLAGASLLGVVALRAEGRAALAGFSLAASGRRSPGPAALDAALGLLGAVLLVVPGFLTGAVGAVLLVSPTRQALRRALSRHLARRVMLFGVAAERFSRRAAPADVDGTAIDDNPAQLGR
jgi:UPF0716 protein FxsA